MTIIRKLTEADINRATEVMAKAFYNDPLWLYLLPDDRKRASAINRVFRVFVTAGIRSQQAYGAGDPLGGFAAWSEPDQETGFSALLSAGFLRLFFSPLALPFIRAGGIFGRFEAMQKQYAPEPHFYLQTIGVHPDAQGRGLASKLIRPFLAKADDQGVSTYTETMTPSNVPLYEHFGFRVMEQYRVPKTDLSIWALYRKS